MCERGGAGGVTLTDRVQEFIEENGNKTAKEVADFFGCHVAFVRKVCQRRGVETKPDKRGGGKPRSSCPSVDSVWDTILFEPYAERKKRRIKRTLQVRSVTWPVYGRGVGHAAFSILSM